MSLLKGTVRSYDAAAGTAEVEIVGSHGQWVTVPVATDLDAKTVVAGKKCAVLSFDDRDSGDAVLVATYDDLFLMGSSPTDDHDHTGDAGDGGQLEADAALLATGDSAGDILYAQGDNSVAWEDLRDHDHSGDAGDGGKLEADAALKATGDAATKYLQPDGSNGVEWSDLDDHDHTGDAGDGGQLEADEVLVATSITDGHVLTADGANGVAWEAAAGGGPVGYLLYADHKAANTGGGTFTSGAWQTRTLNTEVYDSNGDGSLASNQITLPAGTYLIRASAPAYKVDYHQIRLYNVTDSAVIAYGSDEYCGSGLFVSTRSVLTTRFTIGGSKAIRLEHYGLTTKATNGFGVPNNFGGTEVYALLEIVRLS